MTLQAVVGVVLLLGGLVALWFALAAQRLGAAMRDTRTWACAELDVALAGAGGADRVECVGRAAPGPGAPVHGPFSGTPSVWHRTVVTHHYWDWNTSTDAKGNTSRHRSRKTRTLSDERSAQVFTLVDDSGQVLVDPSEARIDGPRRTVDEFAEDDSDAWVVSLGPLRLGWEGDSIGFQREEYSIAPDEPLYVLGGIARRGDDAVLVRPEHGAGRELLISTRSEADLLRRTRRRALWLWIACALATGGGLVLLALAAAASRPLG